MYIDKYIKFSLKYITNIVGIQNKLVERYINNQGVFLAVLTNIF